MHISTPRNIKRARGATSIKLYLYHTKIKSIFLTWAFPLNSSIIVIIIMILNIIDKQKAMQKPKAFVILQRERCGQKQMENQ